MGWFTARTLSVLLLSSSMLIWSCDDDDYDHYDHVVYVDHVAVDVYGDTGVAFSGFVEDDNGSRSLSGIVPLSEDYLDQVNFFNIRLDKTGSNNGTLCVRATSSHDSHESCTTAPFGSVQVTLSF